MEVNGYIFDTNILIDFGERLYPLDIFPSLWGEIELLIDNGFVLLTSGCLSELQKKSGDEVHDLENWRSWFINKGFSLNHEDYQQSYSELVNKIMKNPSYGAGKPNSSSTRRFLQKADPWLIAIAKHDNLAIVTQEMPGKLKIPTICDLEGVHCTSLTGFLRIAKLSF